MAQSPTERGLERDRYDRRHHRRRPERHGLSHRCPRGRPVAVGLVDVGVVAVVDELPEPDLGYAPAKGDHGRRQRGLVDRHGTKAGQAGDAAPRFRVDAPLVEALRVADQLGGHTGGLFLPLIQLQELFCIVYRPAAYLRIKQ